MPRTRLLLLTVLLLGIITQVASFYFAFRPDHPATHFVVGLELGWLVLAPVISWMGRKERIFAIMLVSFWVLSVILLAYGGYMLTYHDL